MLQGPLPNGLPEPPRRKCGGCTCENFCAQSLRRYPRSSFVRRFTRLPIGAQRAAFVALFVLSLPLLSWLLPAFSLTSSAYGATTPKTEVRTFCEGGPTTIVNFIKRTIKVGTHVALAKEAKGICREERISFTTTDHSVQTIGGIRYQIQRIWLVPPDGAASACPCPSLYGYRVLPSR